MWRSILMLLLSCSVLAGCVAESFRSEGDQPPLEMKNREEAGDVDAAPSEPETKSTDEGCVLSAFYFDQDHDGWGGTTITQQCAPTSADWVGVGGDCDDENPDVHPKQTSFFTKGYVAPGETKVSFDYDCDGKETESGATPKAACQVQNLACVGSGYLPATPARSGPGVDPFCGSTSSVVCFVQNLQCKPGAPQQATAIGCR